MDSEEHGQRRTYEWSHRFRGDRNLRGSNCQHGTGCQCRRGNATNLCGHNDWRLPSSTELQSLVACYVRLVRTGQ